MLTIEYGELRADGHPNASFTNNDLTASERLTLTGCFRFGKLLLSAVSDANAMRTDQELQWRTDILNGTYMEIPHPMDEAEKTASNEFEQRQESRMRWMNSTEIVRLQVELRGLNA